MSDRTLAARIGSAIREARTRRGRTQDEVAGLCGLAKAAISKAENGRQLPTLPTLVRLAAGVGVSPSSLLAAATRAE